MSRFGSERRVELICARLGDRLRGDAVGAAVVVCDFSRGRGRLVEAEFSRERLLAALVERDAQLATRDSRLATK